MNMAGDDVMKELLLLLYTNQIFYFMKMSPAWFFQYIQSANKEAKKSMNKWTEGRKSSCVIDLAVKWVELYYFICATKMGPGCCTEQS